MSAALNRLAKWRMVFAGWQLGTRAKGDPECDAVSDHREATLIHRVEITALSRLLIEKGVITTDEYSKVIDLEANELSAMLAKRFPGFNATDTGMDMNVVLAQDTMQGWRP